MWPSFSYVLGLRIDYLSPTLYVTDILLLLSLSFLIREESILIGIKRFIQKNQKSIGVIVVFFLCNLIFSLSPYNTLYGVIKLLEMGGFFFLLTLYYKNLSSRLDLLYMPFLFGTAVQALLAVQQFTLQGSVGGIWYYLGERTFTGTTPGIANASLFGHLLLRPYGTLPHPNVLAAYMLVSCGIVVGLVLKTKLSKMQIVCSFLSLILFYGIVLLSLSRICILLSLCGIVYILSRKNSNKITTTSLSLVAILLIMFSFTYLSPRFSSLFTDQAYTQRLAYIQESIQLLSQHPLLGVGWNAYLPALQTLTGVASVQPVHTIFLLYLVETGIVGIGLLAWVVRGYITRMKNIYSFSPVTILLFIITTGAFDHYLLTLQQGQLLFVLLLSLLHRNSNVIIE